MPKKWEYFLYPELRKFKPLDQDLALRRAKDAKLDGVEIMGLTFAVGLSLALTKYSAAGLGLTERIGSAFANTLIAIPLVVAVAGPLYVRRVRRGLREQLSGNSP